MESSNSNNGASGNDFFMSGENVAGRDNIINNYIGEEDNTVKCPYCSTEPENIPESGKITCTNCGDFYFEWKPTTSSVTHFINVPSDLSHKYGDLIFQITAAIKLNKLDKAKLKCEEAIEISSRTPQAWEYLAYCYYLTTKKEDIIKNKARELIKYFKIAEETDPNSSTLQKIRQTIAHKLFHVLRNRINFHRNSNNSEKSKKDWISYYVNSWQQCYQIYPSSFFLKEIVKHFHGHLKENWWDYQ